MLISQVFPSLLSKMNETFRSPANPAGLTLRSGKLRPIVAKANKTFTEIMLP